MTYPTGVSPATQAHLHLPRHPVTEGPKRDKLSISQATKARGCRACHLGAPCGARYWGPTPQWRRPSAQVFAETMVRIVAGHLRERKRQPWWGWVLWGGGERGGGHWMPPKSDQKPEYSRNILWIKSCGASSFITKKPWKENKLWHFYNSSLGCKWASRRWRNAFWRKGEGGQLVILSKGIKSHYGSYASTGRCRCEPRFIAEGTSPTTQWPYFSILSGVNSIGEFII